jgi:hypothetical protein
VDDFDKEVEEAIKLYEDAIGRRATRTRQMMNRHGKIGALSRIVVSPEPRTGFKVLRNNNKLDKTFEAIVVKYSNKFEKNSVEAAQWHLDNPDGKEK